ncbi:MAG: hypothetical protein V9F03_05430 [Microthrixaceae bacterium]
MTSIHDEAAARHSVHISMAVDRGSSSERVADALDVNLTICSPAL